MKFRCILSDFAIASVLFTGCSATPTTTSLKPANASEQVEYVLEFPSSRYPQIGAKKEKKGVWSKSGYVVEKGKETAYNYE
ncbi:hypothetical protein ILT06_31835 [Bacillus sp. 17RED48]|uniref:Uncharacterized protein n=1 Tax=Bacillus mycoides TaxID=1405 RepID=A0A1W6AIN8_BACMY|nr:MULTISPECIES: hypothetical protein [Bacillus]ARJ25689.1 hypothetical protein B7492_32155 [Bacillus mycoides]MBY7115374.1 hypothetical protein [Bacillus sp. 17RED48]